MDGMLASVWARHKRVIYAWTNRSQPCAMHFVYAVICSKQTEASKIKGLASYKMLNKEV